MSNDKPKLNYLKLEKLPIFEQLQLEEALLRADDANWCLINEGTPPAIVMGISGKSEELIHFDKLNKTAMPVIRRFSGGGTVVVDHDTLFITMICNREAVPAPCFPQQILNWNGDLYRHPLRNTKFQLKENDYAIGEKKFGGNAQYFTKERWLHHTTLLWDYDPIRMDVLKLPKKIPQYREGRMHDDFLCKLRESIEDKQIFIRDFVDSVSELFDLKTVSLEDAASYLERPHRKSTQIV